MACGDLHRGSGAGLEAALLGTKVTSSSARSWPLVLPREEAGEVLRAGSPRAARRGFPRFRAAVLGQDGELQGLATCGPGSCPSFLQKLRRETEGEFR